MSTAHVLAKLHTEYYDIYAVQQDTQCCLISKFYSTLMLARHVPDLIGPSSGAFYTSCICRLWYVVIRVLLDTSSRYKVVGRTPVVCVIPHTKVCEYSCTKHS